MKRYFALANLILIPIALYFSVHTFYAVTTAQLDSRSLLGKNRQAATPFKGGISFPIATYKPIIERNLFHTKKGAAQPKSADINVSGLAPTALKLKLLGTVTGSQGKAYAVIQYDKDRQQHLFRAGDEIQNATLKVILREKVVLSVNGQDEILEIEKVKQSSGRSSRRRGSRSQRSEGVKIGSSRAVPKTQKVILKRAGLEEAIENVGDLMKGVNIQPHFEDGKPNGLRLSRIKRQSIFRKMGLRRGDIITGVDGQKIESVDDALALYDRLTSASNVKVEIKRKGQVRILDYDIR
ncbi:MAG: type II secretion system protein GspC [Desulfobacterales bacterium]